MDQEKRVIVAFALSFAVLMLWRVLMVKTTPHPPKPPVNRTSEAQGQSSTPISPTTEGNNSGTTKPLASRKPGTSKPDVPAKLPIQQGTEAEDIVVENDLYKVTLSTEGGLVKSWVLKKYRDEKEELLDLVNQPACESLGFPMSVVVLDSSQTLAQNTALSHKINSSLYVAKTAKLAEISGSVSDRTAQLTALHDQMLSGPPYTAPINLDFTFSDGAILTHKQFKFGLGYDVHVEVSVSDGQHDLPIGVQWPGGFGDNSLPFKSREVEREAVYGTAPDLTTVPQGKLTEERIISGPLGLGGVEDRFFVGIFLPDSSDQQFPADTTFGFARHSWNPPEWKEKELPQPLTATLARSASKPIAFKLFLGPKDLDVLRAVKPPLDGLVNFGWFTIVAKPLSVALHYIFDHVVHNYGWAIITLTFLINLAMFPLKVKAIRSAQHMQKVAPHVKDIQDRYKQYKFNDPRKQKMNTEVMELYKKHGVNPLGGCLPMVIQLPFLYGFYRVLSQSIELRHAPWILWVKDLSRPDILNVFGFPVPVLTTVMVLTMFALTKITPMATTDPGQQRMMMFMPIMMGVMFYFYNLPSGLMLYYSAANVVGIGQQLFINRMMPVPDIVPVARKVVEAEE